MISVREILYGHKTPSPCRYSLQHGAQCQRYTDQAAGRRPYGNGIIHGSASRQARLRAVIETLVIVGHEGIELSVQLIDVFAMAMIFAAYSIGVIHSCT